MDQDLVNAIIAFEREYGEVTLFDIFMLKEAIASTRLERE